MRTLLRNPVKSEEPECSKLRFLVGYVCQHLTNAHYHVRKCFPQECILLSPVGGVRQHSAHSLHAVMVVTLRRLALR